MKAHLILLMLIWVINHNLSAQTLSSEQMKSDFHIFRQALETFHPEMYRYTSEEEFDQLFERIEKSLNQPLSQQEFYKLLRPALVQLKDGHIKWIVQGKDQHYGFFEENLFPIRLYFEEDKVYAIHHYLNEAIPELPEVTAINGIPIPKIKNQLLQSLTYGDGESLGGKYYELNRFFSAYYSTELGTSETYTIDWIVNGYPQKWTGKGISKTEIEETYPASQEPFSFKKINDRTAMLKINRFFSMKREPDFNKFLKTSFKSLSEEGISNLILDLRGNEGGNEKLGIELYRYIALKPFQYYNYLSTRPNSSVDFDHNTSKLFRIVNSFSKEKDGDYQFTKSPGLKPIKPYSLAFKGEVILLLDGQSFSVTTEFASRAQSDHRVTIIGEETAGGAEGNSSGFFTIVTLPNSKIDLGIPRIGFHIADLDKSINPNRGIIPNEVIQPTASDIQDQKDPVMDQALKLVGKLEN